MFYLLYIRKDKIFYIDYILMISGELMDHNQIGIPLQKQSTLLALQATTNRLKTDI